jgi:DNA repair and recombination protein RAD52
MASHHFNNGRNAGANPNQNRPPVNRQQPMAAPARAGNTTQTNTNAPPQPQISGSGLTRSTSWAGGGPRPNPEVVPPPRPQNPQLNPVAGRRVLNQPSRTGPPSAPVSPVKPQESSSAENDATSMPPQGAGFFSARAAQMIPESKAAEGAPAPIPSHLPAFNPYAESPSIRKTPGVDHKSTRPLTRDLKHVPPPSQSIAASGPIQRPGNIVNPQLDAARRIGAPASPSPMSNRGGQYKPPTKRAVDNRGSGGITRAPLGDLPANEPIGADAGGDLKRQRLNG